MNQQNNNGRRRTIEHSLHVQQPYFNALKNGTKTKEGRLNNDEVNGIEVGHILHMYTESLENGNESLTCTLLVMERHEYRSIHEMLLNSLQQYLPNIDTIDSGVAIYRQFYTEQQEKQYGMVGFTVKQIPGDK
jgi:ASC-1-like (ASCH) protein